MGTFRTWLFRIVVNVCPCRQKTHPADFELKSAVGQESGRMSCFGPGIAKT